MNVFCNTTPLLALSSIGQLDLLRQLFNSINIAKSVADECSEGGRIVVPELASVDRIHLQPDEDSFLTTDKQIMRKIIISTQIQVLDPVDFIRKIEATVE